MMTLKELGETLSNMYHKASIGDAVAIIDLFGIKYIKKNISSWYSKKEIA